MQKYLLVLIFLLTNSLSASASSNIILSSKINGPLRTKIQKDLEVLNNFKFKPATLATLKIMNLSELNSSSASLWLNERVNYIVEDHALTKFHYVERENVIYPNANLLPYSMNPVNQDVAINPEITDDSDDSEEGITVMTNIGAALYGNGKVEKKLYGMKISRGFLKGPLKVRVDSPRVGIIQIGEGLFSREMSVNNQRPDSIANSLNRLAIFFHESRHSDGNGESLVFAHSICPSGHDFEGLQACDESLNGSYAVSANMLKEMLRSCDDQCTEREKEMMRLIILNYQNRILPTTLKGAPVTNWDATPERL